MEVFDISQEVLNCRVFKGDAQPSLKVVEEIIKGGFCNLSEISMCCHNGTHVDAPYHFINEGKKIGEINLNLFVGPAYVYEFNGEIFQKDAKKIIERIINVNIEASKRILIKGNAVLTLEGAKEFSKNNIFLYGNESQTVGPVNSPRQVHLELLGKEIVLLEGINLRNIEEGVYLLNAAPLNIGIAEGSPCRAVLIRL